MTRHGVVVVGLMKVWWPNENNEWKAWQAKVNGFLFQLHLLMRIMRLNTRKSADRVCKYDTTWCKYLPKTSLTPLSLPNGSMEYTTNVIWTMQWRGKRRLVRRKSLKLCSKVCECSGTAKYVWSLFERWIPPNRANYNGTLEAPLCHDDSVTCHKDVRC